MEGVPSIILGFAAFFYLTDKPEHARWLEPEEREWLVSTMNEEHAQLGAKTHMSLTKAFSHPRVLHLAGLFFLLQICGYGLGFFGPLILKSRSTWSDRETLLFNTIPAVFGVASMLIAAHYSDRSGERRKFLYTALIFETAAIALAAAVRSPWMTIAFLSVQSLASAARNAPFWALSTSFLTGTASAGGIAFINSVGNMGGFVGPYIFGVLKTRTASYDAGLFVLACIFATAGLVAFLLKQDCAPDAELPPDKNIPEELYSPTHTPTGPAIDPQNS